MSNDGRLFVGGIMHGQYLVLPENKEGTVRFAQQNFDAAVKVDSHGMAYNEMPFKVRTYVQKKVALSETFGESITLEVMVDSDLIREDLPPNYHDSYLVGAINDAALRAIHSTESDVPMVKVDAPKEPLAAPQSEENGVSQGITPAAKSEA